MAKEENKDKSISISSHSSYFEDLSNSSREIIEETSVLHEWYRLIRGIWKKNGVVEPKSFHFSVQHLAIKQNN